MNIHRTGLSLVLAIVTFLMSVPPAHADRISDTVIQIVAEYLHIDPRQLTPETKLAALGVDASDLAAIVKRIESALRIELVWDSREMGTLDHLINASRVIAAPLCP